MTTPRSVPPSVVSRSNTLPVRVPGQVVHAPATALAATGALAVGTLAVGAVALGALAIGRLAIGQLALGSGHVRRLAIDDLTVVRLRIVEVVGIPPLR